MDRATGSQDYSNRRAGWLALRGREAGYTALENILGRFPMRQPVNGFTARSSS